MTATGVPVNTTSAVSDYETTIGFYNVLHSRNAIWRTCF
jgi:hypothetical protein